VCPEVKEETKRENAGVSPEVKEETERENKGKYDDGNQTF